MPIGFTRRDLDAVRNARTPRPIIREIFDRPTIRDVVDQPTLQDVFQEIARGLWSWVAVLTQELTPVVWTRWATAVDERVCPECAPFDGLAWPEGDGPVPPLHPSCRCARVYAFTEWRSRETTTWELRWSRE